MPLDPIRSTNQVVTTRYCMARVGTVFEYSFGSVNVKLINFGIKSERFQSKAMITSS